MSKQNFYLNIRTGKEHIIHRFYKRAAAFKAAKESLANGADKTWVDVTESDTVIEQVAVI